MKEYLKVKCISLGYEAQQIRRFEKKYIRSVRELKAKNRPTDKSENLFNGLYNHRVNVVRPEARAAHIAYCYLRGREYRQIENKCYTKPNWPRVADLVRKYGPGSDLKNSDVLTQIEMWAQKT